MNHRVIFVGYFWFPGTRHRCATRIYFLQRYQVTNDIPMVMMYLWEAHDEIIVNKTRNPNADFFQFLNPKVL